jgi:hypothetical protein
MGPHSDVRTRWPITVGDYPPGPGRLVRGDCLPDDPGGWTLAAVVTDGRRCTTTPAGAPPPPSTASIATLNLRGFCPDQVALPDDQFVPVEGGYLFAAADVHQACDATGGSTVSLHLLATGGPGRRKCVPAPESG